MGSLRDRMEADLETRGGVIASLHLCLRERGARRITRGVMSLSSQLDGTGPVSPW